MERADLVLVANAMLDKTEPLRRETLARRHKMVDGTASEVTYPQVQKGLAPALAATGRERPVQADCRDCLARQCGVSHAGRDGCTHRRSQTASCGCCQGASGCHNRVCREASKGDSEAKEDSTAESIEVRESRINTASLYRRLALAGRLFLAPQTPVDSHPSSVLLLRRRSSLSHPDGLARPWPRIMPPHSESCSDISAAARKNRPRWDAGFTLPSHQTLQPGVLTRRKT